MTMFEQIAEAFNVLFAGPQGLLTFGAILIAVGLGVKAFKAGPKKLTTTHVIWLGLALIVIYFVGAFVYGVFCQERPYHEAPRVEAPTYQIPTHVEVSPQVEAPPDIVPMPMPQTSERQYLRVNPGAVAAFSVIGNEPPLWVAGDFEIVVRNGTGHFDLYRPGHRVPEKIRPGQDLHCRHGGLKFYSPCTLIIRGK